MRRLTALRQDEGGAIAIITGIVLVVLVGMTALVIDVAALYQERRELQNGADAAALAIAEDCVDRLDDNLVTGAIACTNHALGSRTLARTFANANADDGRTTVADVDVDLLGSSISFERGEVEVSTRTLTSGGGNQILFKFATIFDGVDGDTINAAATAVWGPAAAAEAIPLTVGACEYYSVDLEEETALRFHDPSSGNDDYVCAVGPAGSDAPGGFGWLEGPGDCTVDVIAGRAADGITGRRDPDHHVIGCDAPVDFAIGDTILVPIYEDVEGSGSNATYDIAGVATFFVTGYQFGTTTDGDVDICNEPADSSASSLDCLQGYFVTDVIEGTAGTGTSFGTTAINLVN